MWPVGGALTIPKEQDRCHSVPERGRRALLSGECRARRDALGCATALKGVTPPNTVSLLFCRLKSKAGENMRIAAIVVLMFLSVGRTCGQEYPSEINSALSKY